MTHTEAVKFLNNLYSDVWVSGQSQLMHNYYAENFIGHLSGDVFYFEDLVQRHDNLHAVVADIEIDIAGVEIINDLILFNLKMSWVVKENKEICHCVVTGSYRIVDNKIAEAWLIPNEIFSEYRLSKQALKASMLPITVAKLCQSLSREQLARELQKQHLKLSETKESCLYYYLNGKSAKEISSKLKLTYRTVEIYLAKIRGLLNCSTRTELRQKLFHSFQ